MRKDSITVSEAICTAKRMRPSLTVRQLATIFGTSKSAVHRMLQKYNGDACPAAEEHTKKIRAK